jgi:DNA-binding transcriptional LysR family regulator
VRPLDASFARCASRIVSGNTTPRISEMLPPHHAHVDLNLLRYFLAVADAGSFSEAAKKLDLKGSSVSRGVASLEAALGVQLFLRTTRKMTLTADGRALHAKVALGLASLSEALDAVAGGEEQPAGVIRLSAPLGLPAPFLPRVIATFAARYPGVRLDVTFTSRLPDVVAEGIDLAIHASGDRLQDSSLVATRIGVVETQVFAAPSYLAQAGTPATPEEAAKHRWVLLRGAPPGQIPISEKAAHIVCDDCTFAREAVAAGLGLGLLPPFFIRDHVAAGSIVRLLPRLTVHHDGVFVVTPPGRHVPRRVALFREHLLSHFRAEPCWRST